MTLTGIALRAKRREFYEAMIDQFNTTDEEIKRILVNSGFDSFNIDNIKEYETALKKFFTERHNPANEKLPDTPIKYGVSTSLESYLNIPCPIPGCTGKEISRRGGTWECTIGGREHYYAMAIAKLMLGRYASSDDIKKKALELIKGAEILNGTKE